MFKNESEVLSEKGYELLDALFLDVEAFCNDPDLRDEDNMDEQELLTKANEALTELI